ncbi:hypothetical protein HAX54_022430 [Datura stramonium]|uniref:Uncharacterized protein n=1 Tax=Datura stramonium TaxID=4076 RepID=A0ABS8UUD5_DATST|nr:hypothetical protein [Datura stramonium]
MEQNLAVVAKKVWKIVRVALCMLKKGISKQKIMLDIKLMMKRSKISSSKAAFQNLMFHLGRSHHHVDSSKLPIFNFKKHSEEEEDVIVVNALEMVKGDNYFGGFGRQLRITDSPFSDAQELDNHVDEAADQFISKFYRNLRRQSSLSTS